jgi:hypothetical protein
MMSKKNQLKQKLTRTSRAAAGADSRAAASADSRSRRAPVKRVPGASAQADAVILRPDRHVLAYVRAQPAQGAQPLSTVLKPYWDTTPTE